MVDCDPGERPRTARLALVIVTSCLLGFGLTACGGGGGGTPIPPPPPPPPPENRSLTNLVTDEVFDTANVVLGFDVDGAGVTSNVAAHFSGISDVSTVTYDHSATSFTLSIGMGHLAYTQTFAPADIDDARSDTTLRVYTVDNGGGDITDLVLLIPGDPVYGQSYVTLGVWNSTAAAEGFHALSFGTTIFGLRTAAASMPNTGAATYNGFTLGHLNANDTYYQIAGDVQIDVDFGTGDITGAFTNMVKENSVTGGISAWRDFGATGSITSGTSLFSGTTETLDAIYSGNISGGFFGAGTEEIGGIWSLSGAGETAVGGFVGKQ